MAHFARVNDDGLVEEVIVVSNDTLWNLGFPDSEPVGQEFIATLGLAGTWLQCSYSGSFRGAYPGPGFLWDGTNFSPAPDDPVQTEIPATE